MIYSQISNIWNTNVQCQKSRKKKGPNIRALFLKRYGTHWAQELKILLNKFPFAYWIVYFTKAVPSSKKIILVMPVTFLNGIKSLYFKAKLLSNFERKKQVP